MKVRECMKCKNYRRKVWSTYYKPNGYHAIGVSHAYGWCEKHKKRCLCVEQCKGIEGSDADVDSGIGTVGGGSD